MKHSTTKNLSVAFNVVGDNIYNYQGFISSSVLQELKSDLDYVETESQLVFILPVENAAYTYKCPTVLMCAYNAAAKYVESIIGVKLDNSDANWFSSHPLVKPEGLPQKHTVTVLNDLFEPYNIGVSRIFVKKGSAINEELKQWQKVLGINPKAKFSSQYSNLDYFNSIANGNQELLNEFIKTQKDNFCFEYVDYPTKPAVIFNDVGTTTDFSLGGGHSSYYSPRSSIDSNSWRLALQFDRLDRVNRFVEPPKTKYEAKLTKTLDVYRCKSKSGKLLQSFFLPSPYPRSLDTNVNTGLWKSSNTSSNQSNKLLPSWLKSKNNRSEKNEKNNKQTKEIEDVVYNYLRSKFQQDKLQLDKDTTVFFGVFLDEWGLNWPRISAKYSPKTDEIVKAKDIDKEVNFAIESLKNFLNVVIDEYRDIHPQIKEILTSRIGFEGLKSEFIDLIEEVCPSTLLGIALLDKAIRNLPNSNLVVNALLDTRKFIIEECLNYINVTFKDSFLDLTTTNSRRNN